jgi:hypothetical protein
MLSPEIAEPSSQKNPITNAQDDGAAAKRETHENDQSE